MSFNKASTIEYLNNAVEYDLYVNKALLAPLHKRLFGCPMAESREQIKKLPFKRIQGEGKSWGNYVFLVEILALIETGGYIND